MPSSTASPSFLGPAPQLPFPPCPPQSALFLPPPSLHPPPSVFPPSPTSSLPTCPAYTPSSADDAPSFSLTLLSPHHPALLKFSSTSFIPLRLWLPWLDWDGSWVESHPMQTTARCPVSKLSETIHLLQQKGFKQTRVSCRTPLCPHSSFNRTALLGSVPPQSSLR